MTEVKFISDMTVDLVEHVGSDEFICKAARVSTLGAASLESKESEGLLKFLMKNRHGSPFEHGLMTFRIHAPIFVWREFMRHRIGFSYNEQSGRYVQLEPVFYIPPPERNLVQIGKPGDYSFVPGDKEQYELVCESLFRSYIEAWSSYKVMLDAGIANEVARMSLPVSIYSTAYVTCNPRSIMSFLSLRTIDDLSTYKSTPMKEINIVADKIEEEFKAAFPVTHEMFHYLGRVSP